MIDGRKEIVDEIGNSDPALKVYLAGKFADLLNDGAFHDALPGYLYGDAASQARRPIILKRMEKIISIGLTSNRIMRG